MTRTANRLFRVSSLQLTLNAFRCVLAVHAQSKLARCRSIAKGMKLALEVGELKDLPAVLILSVVIVS